jgi:hypothetical protein
MIPQKQGTATPKSLAAALEYAGNGWPVVPNVDKHPGAYLGDEWQEKATTDEDTIIRWFEQWPSANVGILCGPASGVVDIGVNGDGGDEVLRLVFGGEIPATNTFRSRRGPHYWFVSREGLPDKSRYFLGDSSLEVIPGNKPGQVIAPPSECDGVVRKWLPGLSPSECELAEIPDDALQRLVAWDGLSLEAIRSRGNGTAPDALPPSADRPRLSREGRQP